jgi:hypothetical protein
MNLTHRVIATVAVTAAVAILLSACKTTPVEVAPAQPATTTTPAVPAVIISMTPIDAKLEKLAQLGIADLNAALQDATSHQDAVASQCYSGLLPIVLDLKKKLESQAASSGDSAGGPIYLFQRTRDLRGSLAGSQGELQSLRKAVNLACGALQIDIQAGAVDPLGLFSGQ